MKKVKTTEERWEEGISHHPAAPWLVKALNNVSSKYGNDSIDLRMGGDGDNGEELCYHLSILFEDKKMLQKLLSKLNKEK